MNKSTEVFNWTQNSPEVIRCTKLDEKGHYNVIDGFLLEKEGGYFQIVKVYRKNEKGENVIEFIYEKFRDDESVKMEIETVIEMQDRGDLVFSRKVKTNQSSEVCSEYHNLFGTIRDYSEEKLVRRNNSGNPLRTGEILKHYLIMFDECSMNDRMTKGLWLEEKHFEFITLSA